jgi:hypothetical protein
MLGSWMLRLVILGCPIRSRPCSLCNVVLCDAGLYHLGLCHADKFYFGQCITCALWFWAVKLWSVWCWYSYSRLFYAGLRNLVFSNLQCWSMWCCFARYDAGVCDASCAVRRYVMLALAMLGLRSLNLLKCSAFLPLTDVKYFIKSAKDLSQLILK